MNTPRVAKEVQQQAAAAVAHATLHEQSVAQSLRHRAAEIRAYRRSPEVLTDREWRSSIADIADGLHALARAEDERVPTFTHAELREIWNALNQYIENTEENDDGESQVAPAADTANEKLDRYFGSGS